MSGKAYRITILQLLPGSETFYVGLMNLMRRSMKMPGDDDPIFQSLRDHIQELTDQAEEARVKGDHALVRLTLERKRNTQNRLALLLKPKECDENYRRKHRADEA